MSWWLLNIIDDPLLRLMNGAMLKVPAFDSLVGFLLRPSAIFRFGPALAVVTWAWFTPHPEHAQRRQKLITVLAAVVLALVLDRVLALTLPFRDRPIFRPELAFVTAPGFVADAREWSAFPSDHAAVAFALAAGLWSVAPRYGVLVGSVLSVAVLLPRVYMGLHHPSDIVGGALIGVLAWLGLAAWWLRPAGGAGLAARLLRWRTRWPAAFHTVGFVVLLEISIMFEDLRFFAVRLFHMLGHG